MAKKETAAPEQATVQEHKSPDYEHELVGLRLFKDNDKYKDDLTVIINGKAWQIKRGEDVTVPRYVANVIEQSFKQDLATAKLIEYESKNSRF